MASKKRVSPVQLAAQIYGCRVEELLSYREHEDGSVVIIAPSGQKFAYSAESIKQVILAEESPPAPLDKGGAEAQEGPEAAEVPKVSKVSKVAKEAEGPEEPEVPKVSKVAKEAEGPEKPEAPKVSKVSKVAKVAEVVNEHAGTAKRSR